MYPEETGLNLPVKDSRLCKHHSRLEPVAAAGDFRWIVQIKLGTDGHEHQQHQSDLTTSELDTYRIAVQEMGIGLNPKACRLEAC